MSFHVLFYILLNPLLISLSRTAWHDAELLGRDVCRETTQQLALMRLAEWFSSATPGRKVGQDACWCRGVCLESPGIRVQGSGACAWRRCRYRARHPPAPAPTRTFTKKPLDDRVFHVLQSGLLEMRRSQVDLPGVWYKSIKVRRKTMSRSDPGRANHPYAVLVEPQRLPRRLHAPSAAGAPRSRGHH